MILIKVTTAFDVVVDTRKTYNTSLCYYTICFFVWAASYDGLMPPLAVSEHQHDDMPFLRRHRAAASQEREAVSPGKLG